MPKKLTRVREKLTDYRDDYWACGKCKMCQSINVQKVKSARFSANCPCGTRYRFESYYAAGMLEIARAITNLEYEPTEMTARIIYSCNLCGLCQEMCFPLKSLHPTRIIALMREKAVMEGWGPLEKHREMIGLVEEKENPWGYDPSAKARALDLEGALAFKKGKTGTLFFVGCAFTKDDEALKRLGAVFKALGACGVDFGLLGEGEPCCRSFTLAVGDRDSFEDRAVSTIELFESLGVQRVITSCPHCLQVFRDEFSALTDIPAYHTSELLAEALGSGKLKLSEKKGPRLAYHDPCLLGRWCEVYDPPRNVLAAVPGLEAAEFERNYENSWCCGAGGVPLADPELSRWTARERLEEAQAVGAEGIVTACPHCEGQFSLDGRMPVFDICEVIAERL